MTATADVLGTLRACQLCPDDDTARLVFADALEEAGAVDRAAYVRASVRLAACGESRPRLGYYGEYGIAGFDTRRAGPGYIQFSWPPEHGKAVPPGTRVDLRLHHGGGKYTERLNWVVTRAEPTGGPDGVYYTCKRDAESGTPWPGRGHEAVVEKLFKYGDVRAVPGDVPQRMFAGRTETQVRDGVQETLVWGVPPGGQMPPTSPRVRLTWRRGLLERVEMSLGLAFGERCHQCRGMPHDPESDPTAWVCGKCLGSGELPGCLVPLCRGGVLREVVLTDREPLENTRVKRGWEWAPRTEVSRLDYTHYLSTDLYDETLRLGGVSFATADAARICLSRAAVNLSRLGCGLPRLYGGL